jgi:hypothetical protein
VNAIVTPRETSPPPIPSRRLISQQQPISEEEGVEIDELFRNRWRSLLSVDDAIQVWVRERARCRCGHDDAVE